MLILFLTFILLFRLTGGGDVVMAEQGEIVFQFVLSWELSDRGSVATLGARSSHWYPAVSLCNDITTTTSTTAASITSTTSSTTFNTTPRQQSQDKIRIPDMSSQTGQTEGSDKNDNWRGEGGSCGRGELAGMMVLVFPMVEWRRGMVISCIGYFPGHGAWQISPI